MSSKQSSKAFAFGSKRSVSISTSKPVTTSASEHLKTKRSQFAMLASLPFRYAFNNSMLIKQNSLNQAHPSESLYPPSSNLIKSSIDESTSEVGISEENLTKQPSFGSSDIEDYKPISIIFNREDLVIKKADSMPEHDVVIDEVGNDEVVNFKTDEEFKVAELKMNSSSAVNNFSMANRSLADEIAQAAKKTAIRRHHSAPQSEAKWLQAKRKAIVVQMYDTEKSYVEALKILVTKYYLPLKEKDIVERNLINDIFYKIPEIHVHHELLLSSLKSKFDTWDTRQTIGDLLLNIFAKQSVIETYISFVNNYHVSQEAIRLCKEQSNLFSKFVEQQTKEHRGKLTLKDLIIQPVQRIPRYELYIKDFLKCTPNNHSDYQLLTKASKELHTLAERIDQVHKELHESYGTDSQSVLQIVQDVIENIDDLVNAYRYYIRHDMITIISPTGVKKDRCLFLFSDLIIITSCKRRSGNINKRQNSIILNSPIGKQYLESIKYKYIIKFQLEDIELTGSALLKKLSIERDFLEEDLNTITRINELVKSIVYPHQNLDESIKEITTSIVRQLNESSTSAVSNMSSNSNNNTSNHNSNTNNNNISVESSNNSGNTKNSSDPLPTNQQNCENQKQQNRSVLTINTMERVEAMTIVFGHVDQRNSWEKCFIEAKKIFFESSSRKPATFLNVIAIPRNRSGVQFTCASARIHLTNSPNDVWICSTDGQMGQVCIMNTFPELTVSSCNTVCNSRISCIQCVPPHRLKPRRPHNPQSAKKSLIRAVYGSDKTESQESSEFCSDLNTIDSQSSFAKNRKLLMQLNDRLDPESLINYDSSDDEEETESQSGNEEQVKENQTATSENIPLLNNGGSAYPQDSTHSTMWIGNDDGSLHIYQFCDSAIRTVSRKNRVTKQFSSSIHSLVYMDNKVFVSLKNGELAIFKRNYSSWNYDSYSIRTIAQNSFNIMLAVAGKLWCSSANSVIVLSPSLITIDHHFAIESEQNILLATGGHSSWSVWVASQNNLDLRLYHATKYTLLAEINIKQCVSQKLAGLEELLRIHKLACLKITCMYVCKDTLWIGTSAGVICNVKTPHIDDTTTKLSSSLSLNALNNGHFGPVRFITSVEIAKNPQQQTEFVESTNSSHKTVAISGGEGYEEYKHTASSKHSNEASTANTDDAQTCANNNSSACNSPANTLSSSPGGGSLQPQVSSASADDCSLGKDDLINYVLTWEI